LHVSVRQLRMAALNEPYSGDMHGVRGADHACYRQAQRANMRGTFRAFISSRVQDLDSIVRPADRNLPVINTRVRFFKNTASLLCKYFPKIKSLTFVPRVTFFLNPGKNYLLEREDSYHNSTKFIVLMEEIF